MMASSERSDVEEGTSVHTSFFSEDTDMLLVFIQQESTFYNNIN